MYLRCWIPVWNANMYETGARGDGGRGPRQLRDGSAPALVIQSFYRPGRCMNDRCAGMCRWLMLSATVPPPRPWLARRPRSRGPQLESQGFTLERLLALQRAPGTSILVVIVAFGLEYQTLDAPISPPAQAALSTDRTKPSYTHVLAAALASSSAPWPLRLLQRQVHQHPQRPHLQWPLHNRLLHAYDQSQCLPKEGCGQGFFPRLGRRDTRLNHD